MVVYQPAIRICFNGPSVRGGWRMSVLDRRREIKPEANGEIIFNSLN